MTVIKTALSPDYVLEQAIGQFESVLIIGFDHDGDMAMQGSRNVDAKTALWLVESFKHSLLNGEFGVDE